MPDHSIPIEPSKFRNWLRFWLYQVPQEFQEELEIMRDEDGLMIEDKLGYIPEDLTVHRIIKLLDLDSNR